MSVTIDSTNPRIIADNIRKLDDAVQSAASELPEVETTDEGKVLTVNASGKWSASDLPGSIPKDYSTTEQDTGVKWVDGSTIYRKCVVYDGSGFTAATYKAITTIAGINEVIEGYCTSKLTAAGYYYVLKPNSVRAAVTGGVDFRFDSAIGATDGGYAILYYTKAAPSALNASPDRALNAAPETDAEPEQEAEPVLKKATRKKTTTNKEEE